MAKLFYVKCSCSVLLTIKRDYQLLYTRDVSKGGPVPDQL